MNKIIAVCGKLCSGKSTYAEKLRRENNVVVLSIDEIMLSLFGSDAGAMHDTYAERTQNYLLYKSLELIEAGISVVLDWGFWTREKRDNVKAFYSARSISCELHYLAVGDEIWNMRIEQRNAAILAGKSNTYFVDEGLRAKFNGLFEEPDGSEIDVWV